MEVNLSPRELEVTIYASAGYTNARMARLMGCCTATVERHIETARYKLNATNRAHLVANAFHHGILKVGGGINA